MVELLRVEERTRHRFFNVSTYRSDRNFEVKSVLICKRSNAPTFSFQLCQDVDVYLLVFPVSLNCHTTDKTVARLPRSQPWCREGLSQRRLTKLAIASVAFWMPSARGSELSHNNNHTHTESTHTNGPDPGSIHVTTYSLTTLISFSRLRSRRNTFCKEKHLRQGSTASYQESAVATPRSLLKRK